MGITNTHPDDDFARHKKALDNQKKIEEALELIRSFEPLEEWRGQEDPETSEDLVREIKKILEK